MNDIKSFRKSRFFHEKRIASPVLQLRIDEIRANRAQPRIEFDNNSIIRLADSIRRYGILQPLVVRVNENDESYPYELVAGERRLRAARLLGFFSVPCVLIEADEKMSAEMAIIENLLREDLNMFEEAYAFRQLIDNYSMTQEEVARKVSLSQSAVANKLRLLKLSYEEQQMIIEKGLTERHARALLKLENKDVRSKAILHIANCSLNVSATEQYIEKLLRDGNQAENTNKNEHIDTKKAANEAILAIKKRIDLLKRSGGSASFDVVESDDDINIHVKICKC